jgi:predicted RNase H-like HicB family nuclease
MERLTAVFERDEDGWRVAVAWRFRRPQTQDKTIEEARENLEDAIYLVLEVRRENAEKQCERREMIREPTEV